MNNLPATGIIMTSLELVDYINAERESKAIAAGTVFPSKGHSKLRHDQFLAKVPKVLGECIDGSGRTLPCYYLTKREACLMAMSYSYELQTKVFDRMTALEQANVPVPQIPANKSDQIQAGLLIVESATRLLNLSQSSRLGALQELAGLPALMPVYAIDAPSDAVDGSSRLTAAITTLLKLNSSTMSAPVAYRILERLRIVERKNRPSTRHGEKYFWSITTSGLRFGKISPLQITRRKRSLISMKLDSLIFCSASTTSGGEANDG
ncbi:Rha family transcriptional regulator [Erwinia tracheiphila]|uniref:hypothetical protein n=1 Tax=Erwinia tracheiphila TaxID=65700 RepID=UPI000335DBDB|nr:hypothetical protein [Erwinia tracheiphila]EOS94818.1 hypothetical protein ETR_11688 [Erwinia tracheiphila PSU-1]UIA87314.1 Rha family transcriptional regulator [Erwinia tracheiphila]UIA95678.1 Rha family transcriptional regulator [Erwinia tracheiphila]